AVLGPALQLQQARLADVWVYVALCVAALFALGAACGWNGRGRPWLLLAAAVVLAAGAAGWRACAFQATALAPALEGRDLRITGVVAAMPQRTDGGLRFRLDVEAAQLAGREVRLPPRILLGWYAGEGEAAAGPA